MAGIPNYLPLNTTGTSAAVMLDWATVPFNVSWAFEIQASTATFQVQYTLDNPNAAIDGWPVSTTVTWFTDVNSGTTATASMSGNYMFPVTALRAQVSACGSSFLGQFVVIQGLPYSG